MGVSVTEGRGGAKDQRHTPRDGGHEARVLRRSRAAHVLPGRPGGAPGHRGQHRKDHGETPTPTRRRLFEFTSFFLFFLFFFELFIFLFAKKKERDR